MLLIALNAAHAQVCTATTAELLTTLEQAEADYQERNRDGVLYDRDQARELLPCLTDALTRPLAAQYHRVEGLAAFLERDDPTAREFFASARALEPGYVLPTSLAPEGHPVRSLYMAFDRSEGRWETLPTPHHGHVQLDGLRSMDRSLSFPTLYQRFDETGAVVETALLLPGDASPTYPLPPLEPEPEPPRERKVYGLIEVNGGLGKGTHHRVTNTLILQDPEGQTQGRAQWDGLTDGQVPTLSAGVGVMLGQFVEVGAQATAFVGFQSGSVSIEHIDQDGAVTDTEYLDLPEGRALQWALEPRLRLHLPTSETTSIFGSLGASVLTVPGTTEQLAGINVNRDALRLTGVQAGMGATFSVPDVPVSLIMEVPFTWWLDGAAPTQTSDSEFTSLSLSTGVVPAFSYRFVGGLRVRI